jgi:predicted alpha-1,2-mannosidase
MADKLGKTAEYNEFMSRSGHWKNLFHPEHRFIFPRDKAGEWRHINPLSGRGFVEANSWQATWSVSHDLPGLARLMGGNDAFCEKLNSAFEQAADQDFMSGYGSGTVSYANQPGCSNAHLFSYAGKPWLTQYWVRQVNEKAYGGVTPDLGYGGHDEDQGQMGGVSVLMSMGLFSVRGTCAQNPIYEITSPVFESVVIHLDNRYYPGRQFKITTVNNSYANMYIQSARLNGQPLNRAWFYHSQLAAGGHLELTLGPKPNMAWGGDDLPGSDPR